MLGSNAEKASEQGKSLRMACTAEVCSSAWGVTSVGVDIFAKEGWGSRSEAEVERLWLRERAVLHSDGGAAPVHRKPFWRRTGGRCEVASVTSSLFLVAGARVRAFLRMGNLIFAAAVARCAAGIWFPMRKRANTSPSVDVAAECCHNTVVRVTRDRRQAVFCRRIGSRLLGDLLRAHARPSPYG
ncbi:hypothetical protein FGB62_19g124 [Gracilaria domingensis]|nr:hypothetical protein FGB62_19g124 [Gracilaria domingensis]